MPVTEELKNLRSKGYSSNDKSVKEVPSESPRIIKLSEEELKQFEGVNPGEEVYCKVGATYSDGKMTVMSNEPEDKENEEDDMVQEVAQRVQPTIQPSPSA